MIARHACIPSLVLFWIPAIALADGWKDDPVWHDGLVEKAVYSASRVVYGRPREYEAIFFTNKERHDRRTLTKADKSADTIEVWKFNQIEDIPTPNYHYHYETTSHLSVENMELTRLDCSSQEFCGTSFKQFITVTAVSSNLLKYWSFSYMPEAGRVEGAVQLAPDGTAADSLPLFLRDFDFVKKQSRKIELLPTQKSNRATDYQPKSCEVRFAGEEDGSYKLELYAEGKLAGTYSMSSDRLHVMTKYQSADGSQTYQLKSVSRVNYWTIKGE